MTSPRAATTADPRYSDGIAFIDGRFVPIEEARIPILDWGFLRSDACQDTVSAWDGSFFRLEDHLARFERSFSRLRMTCPHDRDTLRAIVLESVVRTGFRNAYTQMIMTRGRPPIGSRDVRLAENKFWLFTIPFVWIAKPEQKAKGLAMHVSDIVHLPKGTVDPTIKNYHWLDFQMGLLEAYDAGAETVCLVDGSGNIAEGPGFNVFMVKDGRIATPPSDVCLDGMTRDTVMKLAAETNQAVSERAIPKAEMATADEIFLTTTGGGVIPITTLDGRRVGSGEPGPVTQRLDALYWQRRTSGWLATPVDYAAMPRFAAG